MNDGRRRVDAAAYRRALAGASGPVLKLLDAIGRQVDSGTMEQAAEAASRAADRLRQAAAHLNEHK